MPTRHVIQTALCILLVAVCAWQCVENTLNGDLWGFVWLGVGVVWARLALKEIRKI